MTNKYLEKIAAKISTIKKLRNVQDVLTVQDSLRKKKAKKKVDTTGRKWNRGTVRKNT